VLRPGDEPGLLEDLEVLGDRGPADRQRIGQLSGAQFSAAQTIDDRPSRRIGESPEDEVKIHLTTSLIKQFLQYISAIRSQG